MSASQTSYNLPSIRELFSKEILAGFPTSQPRPDPLYRGRSPSPSSTLASTSPSPSPSGSPSSSSSHLPLTPVFIQEHYAPNMSNPPPMTTPELIWLTPNTSCNPEVFPIRRDPHTSQDAGSGSSRPLSSTSAAASNAVGASSRGLPPSFKLVATTSLENADAVIFVPSPKQPPASSDRDHGESSSSSRPVLLVGSAISRQLRKQAKDKNSGARMHPYRIVRVDGNGKEMPCPR